MPTTTVGNADERVLARQLDALERQAPGTLAQLQRELTARRGGSPTELHRTGGQARVRSVDTAPSVDRGVLRTGQVVGRGGETLCDPPEFDGDARWWARVGARDLGIPTPSVHWFNPREGVTRMGFWSPTYPDSVFVRSDLSRGEVIATVLHETAHVAGLDEVDALLFERERAPQSARGLSAPKRAEHDEWELHAGRLRGERFRRSQGRL